MEMLMLLMIYWSLPQRMEVDFDHITGALNGDNNARYPKDFPSETISL